MQADLDDKIIELLRRSTSVGRNAAEIEPDTDLMNDLGLDSIAMVHFLADAEEEFQITVKEEEISLPIFSNFRSLKGYIIQKMGANRGSFGND